MPRIRRGMKSNPFRLGERVRTRDKCEGVVVLIFNRTAVLDLGISAKGGSIEYKVRLEGGAVRWCLCKELKSLDVGRFTKDFYLKENQIVTACMEYIYERDQANHLASCPTCSRLSESAAEMGEDTRCLPS